MTTARVAIRVGLIAAVAAALAAPVLAQAPSAPRPANTPKPPPSQEGPAWTALTPAQRRILAPLERDWGSIDGQRKAKWLEIATKFPSMPADEQRRMQARMAEWAHMTPAERGRARLSFQEAKQLSPQQRQERWEAYQALPPEDREALAARARRAASPKTDAGAPLAATPKQSATAAKPATPPVVVKPVAPTIVQVQPGATTTLMTKKPAPPPHQKPGEPKIQARPNEVNRTTLLPRTATAQAAPRPATAASQPASQP